MKKQLLSAIFLSSLILSGLLLLGVEVWVAGASGTVYIRADGSVDPPSAPIQRAQDVYTFYSDANASLVLQRDSVVIDGAGHALRGEGNGTGVDLSGRSNVTIENLAIKAFYNGVYLSFSYDNTLSGNNITENTDYGIKSDRFNDCSGNVILNNSITGNGGGILLNPHSNNTRVDSNYVAANNGEGIYLYATAHDLLSNNEVTANNGYGIHLDSHNTTLRNNRMTRDLHNFGVEAYFLDVFVSNDVDVSNTVDGKPVYYWFNEHGVTVPSDAGYVALINCSNVTVKGLNLTNNGEGVVLFNTENCTITQNNIANNWMGFSIDGDYETVHANNNSITYNNMTNNDLFQIENSVSTTLSHNNIMHNDAETTHPLLIGGHTSNNLIRYNNFTNSYIDLSASPNSDVSYNNMLGGGIGLRGTSNTTVTHNNITAGETGISLSYSSSDNVICYNNVEASQFDGVYLSYSSCNNNISHNRIVNNTPGLEFSFSSNGNTVSDNEVTGNDYGVRLDFGSSNNVFTHNSFVNNTDSATSFTGANVWDSGYILGGNFWSDYGGSDVRSGSFQNGTGSDGIGDMPYTIVADNIDHFPLMKPYGGPHDVGVRVSVSKTVVPEGYNRTISMNVTIINYGEWAETFNFTCQTGTTIQEQTLTLMERNSTAFTFSLNVTGLAEGNYTLHVQASPVVGETDTMDNTYDGVLIVSIVGDINGDRRVDMTDVGYAARRFGIGPSSLLWNPNVDINDDLKIDMKDIGTVCRHFGDQA